MIQILVKELCIISRHIAEKRMPVMNFKIGNAKNLKMEFYKTTKIEHIFSLRFYSLAASQRYKRGFVKKIRAINLKFTDVHA